MTDLVLERILATFVDRVEYQPSLTSTNDRARELAAEVPRNVNLLMIADEQTAGRGRGSNRWWTGPGSLAFSLLLDPQIRGIERRWLSMIALAAAAAIVESVRPRLNQTVGIHWPNDVFVDNRKLAGVLVEVLPDGRNIVGIGLNVNNSLTTAPAGLQAIATTLYDLTGTAHDRTTLLVELLTRLDAALHLLACSPQEIGRRSDQLCLQHRKQLTLQLGDALHIGHCLGIAEDGALRLETERGRETFYSGVLVKPSG